MKSAKFRKLERRRDRVNKGLAHPDTPLAGRLSTMVSGPFQKEIGHGDNQVRYRARLSGRSHQLVKTHVSGFPACAQTVALSGKRDAPGTPLFPVLRFRSASHVLSLQPGV